MILKRPAILASAVVLTAVAGIGYAVTANSSSTLTDGNYACTFASGFDCTPTPIPTITTTATETATATETTTVTASPTQSAAALLTGTSAPGLAVWPNAPAVRTYWGGLPSTTLPSAPAGAVLFVSFKTAPANIGPFIDAWQASGRTVYWTWHHEPDNGDMTGAAFVTETDALLAQAATRPHSNVHSMTILTANSLVVGNADQYYVPGVDVIGFDDYNLNNEPKCEAYATAHGKRLIFGEVGNVLNGATDTDAQALAFAQSFWGALDSNTLAALWWSGSTDTLVGKPNTTAFLASQP